MSVSMSESLVPSDAPSSAHTAIDKLEFISWNPPTPMEHCTGDCDRDDDCSGEMICFQRSGASPVPGCESSDGIPAIADFCAYPSDAN